ncbi:hypothetical protein TSAR_007804 [Trichomalopsis sarcophagae]|uniref:Uncharacterized protein n=1 Tax=Trichomalopsis sarcophagae TaxID=543379 RepID=A0A232EQC1_9HYME|nr:hypothetical protein TSAR_007804 [Trichomalopsis sarcophagae]
MELQEDYDDDEQAGANFSLLLHILRRMQNQITALAASRRSLVTALILISPRQGPYLYRHGAQYQVDWRDKYLSKSTIRCANAATPEKEFEAASGTCRILPPLSLERRTRGKSLLQQTCTHLAQWIMAHGPLHIRTSSTARREDSQLRRTSHRDGQRKFKRTDDDDGDTTGEQWTRSAPIYARGEDFLVKLDRTTTLAFRGRVLPSNGAAHAKGLENPISLLSTGEPFARKKSRTTTNIHEAMISTFHMRKCPRVLKFLESNITIYTPNVMPSIDLPNYYPPLEIANTFVSNKLQSSTLDALSRLSKLRN